MTEGRLVRELSRELSAGTGESAGKPKFTASAERRLRDDGLDDNAIGNLVALLAEQRESAGIVPNDRELVVERSREEDGDWRIIVHSPFGRRVHEPWAMAITTRLKQRYGFDGQVHAADDGIILRLPDGYADMRARDLILFDCDELQHIVETQIGESVLYMARFRECAARSLFLPRTRPGKRVPLWQQRLKAAQLLNAARTCRNFPLLLETARECLQDVYDLPALRQVMAGLNDGVIDLSETATRTPSPFAEQLLFGFVGSVMYQYDVPQAERSTQLLSMDPEVLERLLGAADMASLLDPDAIAQVEKDLAGRTFWNDLDEDDVTGRVTRYAKTHGPFTADQMIAQLRIDAARAVHALDELNAKGTLLKGRFSDPDQTTDQWLHIEVFRRIRSLSLAKARRAVKPVDQAAYQAFLLDRQGVGPVGGARYEGVDGLLRVIEQLEGVPLNADVWESSVFPARVRDYEPGMLDELLASGEVVWVGSKFNGSNGKDAGSIAFHPADSRLLDVPDGSEQNESSDTDAMTVPEAVLAVLNGGGAFPARQLSSMAKTLWQNHAEIQVNAETGEIMYPSWNEERFEEALWFLIWQGRITNSSFMPVRSLSHRHGTVRAPRMSARRRVRMRPSIPATLGGLWSAVNPDGTVGSDDSTRPSGVEEYEIELVESLLDRYGVLASPLVDKERIPGGFSGLYPVLKRMEEHGLLVRGMFVKGFGAAQFASRNTVDVLRDEHASRGLSCVALDVTDPAVLTGAAIAWPQQEHLKPARRAGSIIVLAKGAPVMFAMPKSHKIASFTDDEPTLRSACAELAYTLQRLPSGSVSFAEMNGESLNACNDARRLLRAAGFADSPQGMKLYR